MEKGNQYAECRSTAAGRRHATVAPSAARQRTQVRSLQAYRSGGAMPSLIGEHIYSIQQSAALALGRLANHSEELAEEVVSNQILPQLVCNCLHHASVSELCLGAVAWHCFLSLYNLARPDNNIHWC